MTDVRPLQPLSHGNILIVGVKSSNLSEEIRVHPRVTIWDSQQKHWTDKEMPQNIRAVFVTRFIGHSEFANIIREARKKRITIFNPEGTGLIARQVKELLNMTPPPESTKQQADVIAEKITNYFEEMKETTPVTKTGPFGKLKALIPFIDFSKNNRENADILLPKCKELGFTSTHDSLANFVGAQRRGGTRKSQAKSVQPVKQAKTMDVSVDILDGIIKELQDMRAFLIATTDENMKLKSKVDKFKRFFEE